VKLGLVSGKKPVKILGDGDINTTLTVRAHVFSKEAKRKIEERGGKAEIL